MAEVRRMQPLLGTFVEIRCEDNGRAHDAIARAFAVIADIGRQMSFHDPASELSRLNQSAGNWVTLAHHTLRVLRLAIALGRRTNDAFNCSVGGALVQAGVLPDHGGPLLPTGSADDIVIRGNRAMLRRPVRVTLDGIAKGYAIDLATRMLRLDGVANGCVNAGGDLRLFGRRTQQLQVRTSTVTIALPECRDIAMATSTFTAKDTSRFPSMLYGNVAQPTVTVIAPMAWRADALTKVAAQLPADEAAARIQALGGALITPQYRLSA